MLNIFQGNCQRIVFDSRSKNRISNSKLYEKKIDPTFQGYNERKVGMARPRFKDEG